jgi:tRNA-dihydrouridine synthase C
MPVLHAYPPVLMLAPMEGLLDCALREALSSVGGVARCVSEFIRVTDTLLPPRVYTRIVPELLNGSRTRAGVAVRPQLLGSDPVCLAENAAVLATLAPAGIDLNFGCPAKVVNRHRGGAILLDEPELVGRIVAAVRRAVPAHIEVSAKMRLGVNDHGLAVACAQAIAEAGADELVVHARTKAHGYRPPAYWELIAPVREAVRIPVVANGEIWTVGDARRCLERSGCAQLMLGRGMVADPGLALAIVADAQGREAGRDWASLQDLLHTFWLINERRLAPRHRTGRMKQWLHYLRRRHPEAEAAYQDLRTVNEPAQLARQLFGDGRTAVPPPFIEGEPARA